VSVLNGELAAWRKALQAGASIVPKCAVCGCEYALSDGVTAIIPADVSKPALTSIGPATGSKAGGTSVALVGHAFDIGTLVVKFDGVSGTGLVVTDMDHATIVTSAAPRVFVRCQGAITGTLAVGDTLTGSVSGKTCEVAGSGVVAGVFVLTLVALTGPLTPGEFLEKDAGNKVQVAASGIYAPCDVAVENVNGMRVTGAKLVGAFTFTP
jgi:hypothetical protein